MEQSSRTIEKIAPQAGMRSAYSRYYRQFIQRFYEYTIPVGSRVWCVGEHDPRILIALKSQAASFEYSEDIHTSSSAEHAWDYVIIGARGLAVVQDVQELLSRIALASDHSTRVILEYSQVFWQPLVYAVRLLGLKKSASSFYAYTSADIRHFLELSGYEIVEEKRELLAPFFIPFISTLLNYVIARVPILSAVCYKRFYIARLKPQARKEYSVSVIIPCKNEAGNIHAALQACPVMGKSIELIFVDGNSSDNSHEVFKELPQEYEGKRISWFTQTGKGKKNAVEEGFARAQGELLMILDGDVTVAPHELPKFYEAIAQGRGECINGSRLVYPLERGAMPPLNWFVNHAFALLFSVIIGQRVKDTLCGTKVLTKDWYEKIVKSKDFFGDFDPFGDFDIVCGAAYQHMKIIDVPVHYKSRRYGVSQVSYFSNGLLLLRMLWIMVQKMILRW